MTSSEHSFADVMGRLQKGDQAAAFAVFQRFARALVLRARQQLGARLAARVDAEDVVQSAYRSFIQRHTEGQFHLENWQSLWSLLVVITLRKCANTRKYHQRECRAAALEVTITRADSTTAGWDAPCPQPTPEEAMMLAETLSGLMAGMDAPEREIVSLSLQGFTVLEIKDQLGRAERTVRRVRERFRENLERLCEEG